MPQRVQLRRTKGWRKPAGVIVVARPSRWENPFVVGELVPMFMRRYGTGRVETAEQAVDLFRRALIDEINRGGRAGDRAADVLLELRGHDLACWCRLGAPCHADVLLELANLELVA